ncbi:MAG: type II secretion system inner membrane protein GspF [Myxococcales bacterium]|nr:type II secretion system inner membrane protein GspF [Myxococcales bacterium]MDD9970323.1 type II secretion system inner membrane protein GspF [Myxococcales bacterium]
MAVFQWQGINSAGKDVKGIRDADNPKILRAALRKEGILATRIEEDSAARVRRAREIDFAAVLERVSSQEIALLTRQLATLLRSGVPLVEALSALIEQVDKPKLKAALTQTRDKVNEGTSLADALQAHPKIFESLYVNMVAAGEASGTLDVVLERLADHLDASAELKSEVSSALAYPAFMVLFAIGVVALMMTVVVPKVTAIFDDFNQALPWYTQLLILTSHTLTDYWWLLAALVIGAFVAFRRWLKTPEGRAKWDAKLLTLPLVGKLVTMIAVARFARTLSTLLSSGVSLLTALDITKNVLGNAELTRVVEEARGSIREGESIAAPLKRSERFPPIVTHMIAIGERSGELEQMLEHVASAYDRQVTTRLAAVTSLLEPLVIVTMGAVIASIALSILMPLMQINEFIG